jgi:hypothetical protein
MFLEEGGIEALKEHLIGRRIRNISKTSIASITDVYLKDNVVYVKTEYEDGLEVEVPLFDRPGLYVFKDE